MEPVGTTRASFIKRLSNRSDALSWNEFHDRYGRLLYRYAQRCGASIDEAEDVVQEVEMYLFKAMDGFRYDPGKGRFRAYLRMSVLHALGRKIAKKTRHQTYLDAYASEALLQDEQQDQRWEREWRLHRLREAFHSIAGEFQPVTLEAFRLRVLADRPIDEICEHLGLSKASVYQAKARVLKRLRQRIDEMISEDSED